MKPNPKYKLTADEMRFSFTKNNMDSCITVPYHDQEHYYKNKTLIRNNDLGKNLIQLMKISGNEHLVEDIENTL